MYAESIFIMDTVDRLRMVIDDLKRIRSNLNDDCKESSEEYERVMDKLRGHNAVKCLLYVSLVINTFLMFYVRKVFYDIDPYTFLWMTNHTEM